MTQPDNTQPHESTPADPRPRPQFGEYAPPGWVSPHQDALDRAMAATPTPETHTARPTPSPAPNALPPASGDPVDGQPTGRRTPGLVSVATSVLLLVFSVIGAQSSVSALDHIGAAFQDLYDQYGLGEFVPFNGFDGIVESGRISQFVLWAIVAAVTILLMMRKRHAWYIPLIGGVLSIVLIVVVVVQVMLGDPTLTDYLTNGGSK